jgi:ppGpp synthetase/RelA/SpoT-type nucleotidyltranferase
VEDLDRARKLWAEEQATYQTIVDHVVAVLKSEFLGPQFQIYGRPKKVDSILKKLILKPDKTYESMTDKAGIRVVVRFTDKLDIVGNFIEGRFPEHKKDDKRCSMKSDQVGYQAIHYDIKIDEGEDSKIIGLWAEVQVRTMAQHLWSEMSHGLAYKPGLEVPNSVRRWLMRLSALIEVADDEFLRVRDALHQMPDYDTYKVLELLETQFYKFAAADYDKELSVNTINAFNHLYGEGGLAQRNEEFDTFCQQRAERLSHVFDTHRVVGDYPLFLFQPEALMIFQLLEKDRFTLRQEWVKYYPIQELERLAIKWGKPYAT